MGYGFMELSNPRPVGASGWPGKLGDAGGVAGVRDASLQCGEDEFSNAWDLLMAFGGLQLLRLIGIGCTINARVSFIRGSHVNQDRGYEHKQAPAKRHAEKGNGGSIGPK